MVYQTTYTYTKIHEMHRNWVNISIVQRLNVTHIHVTSQRQNCWISRHALVYEHHNSSCDIYIYWLPHVTVFGLGECMYFFEAIGIDSAWAWRSEILSWPIVSYHLLVLRSSLGITPKNCFYTLVTLTQESTTNLPFSFPAQHWFLFSPYTQSLSPVVLSSTPCHPGVLKNAENGTVTTQKATVMRFHCNCFVSGTQSSLSVSLGWQGPAYRIQLLNSTTHIADTRIAN